MSAPRLMMRSDGVGDPHVETVVCTNEPKCRLLVVIDPEDREQVARLGDAFCHARWSHVEGSDECDPLTFTSMQQALRNLIAPPRPEEPQGLGAVVEDSTGGVWVRAEATVMNCWTNSRTAERVMWHKIDGPRLLSEGWRADA